MRAVLLRLCLIGLLALGGAARAHHGPAQDGRLDLTGWDFARDGTVLLDGEWLFAPDRLIGPREPWPADARTHHVPGHWNEAFGGGDGVGTYRLQVQCAATQPLAVALPFQHSALALYVNGRLVARQGQPGIAADEGHAPEVRQQLAPLDGLACPLELTVQVSNHELFRGGLVRSMQLGTREQLATQREQAAVRNLLALGAVGVVGLFALLFFYWRRQDRTPLYFGLFCLSFSVSLALSGERVLQSYVEWMSFTAQMRLLFLSWFIALLSYPLLIHSLYPRQAGARVAALIGGVCGLGALVTLLAPVRVFSQSAPPLQAAAAVVAFYLGIVLARAIHERERGGATMMAGLLVLVAAVAHDVVFFQHLLATSLLPYGMAGFILAPAVLIARRFARALSSEELRVIEQRGRSDLLVRATQAGLLDWDAVNDRIAYSDRYKQMLGYAADMPDAEVPRFDDLLHPDDAYVTQRFRQQLRDRSVCGSVRHFESLDYRLRRRNGQYLWVHAEGMAVCGEDGRTLRFICSFIDITQRIEQEQELSNRAKFIGDLFESVPLGLALRDTDGRYLIVNRTWERHTGLSRDAVIGQLLADVDHPLAAQARQLDSQVLAGRPGVAPEPLEYDFNGRRLMQTRTLMVDAEGRPVGLLAASLDITEKYAVERALATERERLGLLVRSTHAGFSDWDTVRNVVAYTDRFKELLGWPADTDTSTWPSIFEMIHPDDRERVRERVRAMLHRRAPGESDSGQSVSYRLRKRDGSYLWIQAEGISLVDDGGRTRRFITSYLDVTRFHEQEQALRRSRDQVAAQAELLERQNEALKEAVRLREEVERISRHDLKTPLNSIVAVPRLLREERRLGPEADELLGIVERAGYRILSMVNLSLDLYKMEQGSYAFRPDAVDLPELVRKLFADVRVHAASKDVRLELWAEQPPYAWAEELLCYSLVANLLKNAVEASPDGGVVTVRVAAAPEAMVRLDVHNDGAVPAGIRQNFFQKYATLGKASGTGLGAYSARLMARVQDGDVTVSTSEEEGTTLSVRLRAAPPGKVPASLRHAASPRQVRQALPDLPPMRVLLVDDDEYNLLILRRFLPSPPLEVETAVNGRLALVAAERQWPDLVFMDLDMPIMGGLEAVAQLRELQRTLGAPGCYMVALSSHEDDATRRRAREAGFDRYLSKPVTREAVYRTLQRMQQPATDDSGPAALGADAAPADAASEVALDAELEPIMAEFKDSRQVLLQDLSNAAMRQDREDVRRLAHRLAGSFALYGFRWAAERSRWLEHQADDLSSEEIRAAAQTLQAHLNSVHIRYEPADD